MSNGDQKLHIRGGRGEICSKAERRNTRDRTPEREIVLGYAECSMNAVETGRKLYLSYVTVGYHLNQIKKSTGIDPRSFYGLCKLVQMAKQIGG